MKKKLSILLLMALLAGLTAGCNQKEQNSGNSAAPQDKESTGKTGETYENGLPKDVEVTLNMAVADEGVGTAYFDAAVELFQSKYPNVKINATKSANIRTIIETKIAAGNDEDIFDIMCIPGNSIDLMKEGLIEPCDDVWDYELPDKPGTKIRDLAPESLIEFSYRPNWPDGQRHVLAFPVSGGHYGGFFYDKKLFEDKDWNQNPKTWQEFLDLCETIKADNIVPMIFTGIYPGYLGHAFANIKAFEIAAERGALDTFVPKFRNYEGDYYLDENFVECWNKIAQLGKSGYWHPGIAALNHTQTQMEIIQRKAAMVSTGSWVGNEMASSVPEGFKWGYMSPPMREKESSPLYVHSSGGGGWVLWANKPDLNKAWSKQFLTMFCDFSVMKVIGETGLIPTIRSDFNEDPARLENMEPTSKAVLAYLAQIDYIEETAGHFDMPAASEFAQAEQLLTENYVDMALGNVEPIEVLTQCQELLDKANASR